MFDAGSVWPSAGHDIKYLIWNRETLVPLIDGFTNKEIDFINIIPNLDNRPESVEAAKNPVAE